MSKYDELKRLAEASTQGVWRAGNAYSKAFVPAYQIVVETDEGPYVIMEGNQNFLPDAVANIAYVAAASPAAILELIAESSSLKDLLAQAAAMIRNADVETGVCCCGSPVETHGFGDGHSPVDQGGYYALDLLARIDAAMLEASK